jgi:ABC-type dipeptide/oligopeptide/nickel transport system permease component
MRYLLRRLVHGVFVLFAVSVLSFVLLHLVPGEFFSEMTLNPQISRATIDALREEYGMDRSLPVQYARWIRSVTKGELGYSFAYNQPVSALVLPRVCNTLLLNTVALVVAWLIAGLLGIWAAARPGKWEDRLCSLGSSTLLVIPDLLLALLLLMIAVRTRWFPAGGMTAAVSEPTLSSQTLDVAAHIVLPVATIVLAVFPLLFRHIRSSVAEVVASPYIQAARGYGIRGARLLFQQALPAAANPLISLLGFSFGALLGVSLLVEVIFSWPGIGPLLLESIFSRDMYVVIAAALLSAALVVAGNLLADVLLFWNDPRIRTES